MKKLSIISLAEKKLQRRSIPEEWIFELINCPAQIVEGYGGRKIAQKKYVIENKEYLLRAIYEENADQIEVITAYLTSQVKRYWKEE